MTQQISKGNTFIAGDTVTADSLNAHIDNATFVSGAGNTTDDVTLEVHTDGYLKVKDGANLVASNLSASTASVGNYWLTEFSLNFWNRPFVFLDQAQETLLQNKTIAQIDVDHSVHLVKVDGAKTLRLQSYLVNEDTRFDVEGTISASGFGTSQNAQIWLRAVASNNSSRFWLNTSRHDDAIYNLYPDQTNTPSGSRALVEVGLSSSGNASDLKVHGDVLPGTHNTYHLGSSSLRWDNLWNDGSFSNSDENLKQDIEELDEAEKRVAVKAKALIKKYRFKRAVAKKGDEARIHVGIIAQELQSAFESEGLDAFRYSMIGKDTWWEKEFEIDDKIGKRTELKTYDSAEKAPSDAIKKTQMSVNYSELLAFIISAM